MKECNKCKEVKSLEEFYTKKSSKSGYMTICKDCSKEAKKKWYYKNKNQIKEYNRKYSKKESRQVYMKQYLSKHQKENKAYWNSKNSLVRAAKLQRTPKWLTEDHLWFLDETYELAQLRTQATGVSHHVDHIIPLQGTNVSGLHVPWNLQVIPWYENLSKSNSYEVI